MGQPIKSSFRYQIEQHMKYKWGNDRNQALQEEEDVTILEQIPEEVQDEIYYKFLHQKFLRDFEKYFTFEKTFTGLRLNFFSWKDQMYRDFMTDILTSLEPRREENGTILYTELDDFVEVLFFNKGQVDIGFELNCKKNFVLRKEKGVIIGDLGCTFNMNSEFLYRAFTDCEGYSIRKNAWQDIMDESVFPELVK